MSNGIEVLAKHMTIAEWSELTRKLNARFKVADALLKWAETTHGNEFGHDHHCKLPMAGSKKRRHGAWVELEGEPPEDPDACTCGWSTFRKVYDAWAQEENDGSGSGDVTATSGS